MKRSEMLILIANQLDFLNGKFIGLKTNYTKEELINADVILTTIEGAGMIPPKCDYKALVKQGDIMACPDILKDNLILWQFKQVNRWEDE